MQRKVWELRWPAAGVVRRSSLRSSSSRGGPYPTPWAVNVRLEDPFSRRLRGGSRAGLTKVLEAAIGTSVADMVSVQTASTTGTDEMLVVLVDDAIVVVSGGVATLPVACLKTETGDYVVTEAGDRIVLSTADAPASGFLVAGKQHVYAVTSSGVTEIDPKTGLINALTASAGAIPSGCTFGAVYRDRMLLAGADNTVHVSKQGAYANYGSGAILGDPGRATVFQLSGAGAVGDTCTALVPHADAVLLAATSRGLWVLRGDPAGSGSLRQVSSEVGIVAPRAWCRFGESVLFLAEDGIYQVGVDGGGLKSLSEDRLPVELRDIDPATTTVLMGYDHYHRAVHIYLTTEEGSDTHWLFELVPESFWAMRVQDDHAPVAVCQYGGGLLLAGADGYLRSAGGDDDDGTAIQSHVLIGPIRLWADNDFGMVQSLEGVMAAGSGTVTCRIVPGDTAEAAAANGKLAIEAFQAGTSYASYVHSAWTWTSGRSHIAYPRTRGMWACLWLQSTAKWAFEGISMETVPFGRWR